MLPLATFPVSKTHQAFRGRLAESQQLVTEFSASVQKNFQRVLPKLTSKNRLYRATRIGGKFWIHEFSTKEFLRTAKILHPLNTKVYLKKCFQDCGNGSMQFVIFSTQTKAHAICEVKTL